MSANPTFIDIGVNLTDPVFRGNYHGKVAHQDDFEDIRQRAKAAGVIGQIITGGSLKESREALDLALQYDDFFSTAGCHPTRTSEMESYSNGGASGYLSELSSLIITSCKIVAIGECGLDYDRLHFSAANIQRKHFASQLDLAVTHRLPLFLHSRAAHYDFIQILRPRIDEIHQALFSSSTTFQPHIDPQTKRVGVVHSFTGTMEEMKQLIELGLFIGVNGCSLKTNENLQVVQQIPLHRLMLETDAPWCDPRPTHESHSHIQQFKQSHPHLAQIYQPLGSVKKDKWTSNRMVKGRNEPCIIGLVAATVASVKGILIDQVTQAAKFNTEWLFGFSFSAGLTS